MTKKQKSENESTKKTHSLFNRPFVRFLSLLLTALIIIPLTAAAVVFTPDVYGDTFLGALAPKLQWLRTAKEKRIIVVGGSSVAFGLDSPMLKQYTGYEVVNFGLYATLGTRIMLDLSEDYIREGDIVILAPEIDSQTLSMYYNAGAVWQAAGSDLSVLSKIHFDNYLETIAQIPEYLSDSLARLFDGSGKISPTGIYRKDSFNEYGDIVYPREYNIMAAGYDLNQIISLSGDLFEKEFIDYINKYIIKAQTKGATVFYTFCPINESALAKGTNEIAISEFYRFVSENIHCPVISDPNDLIMDEGYFYDTNFHLNDTGVKVRTAKLIEDLYRSMGISKNISIELPKAPEKPKPEELPTWVENEWSELFIYDSFGEGLRITGVTEEAKALEILEIPYLAEGKPIYAISADAFSECTELKELTFYDNLSIIENGAFDGATSLERINVKREEAENLEAGAELFENCPNDLKLFFYTESSYQNFVSGYWWSAHAERMELVQEDDG